MTDIREQLAAIIDPLAFDRIRDETVEEILSAFPQMNPQTYSYIGRDGKRVLARDLEDDRDRLREENAALRQTLQKQKEKRG